MRINELDPNALDRMTPEPGCAQLLIHWELREKSCSDGLGLALDVGVDEAHAISL
jgi:hypothetical protein